MKRILPSDAAGEQFRPGGLALTRRAIDYCGLTAGAAVVDIGCGTGVTVEWLLDKLGFAAIGYDISAALITAGRQRRKDLPIFAASAACLPLDAASVAAVLAECSLSVMPDREKVLAEAFRVLQPGGKLALTDMYVRCSEAARRLRADFPGMFPGIMTRAELEQCLQAAGFTLLVWEDHSHVWKEYVARQILAGKPLCGCWCDNAGQWPDLAAGLAVLKQIKPGYCLVIAGKA